MDAAFIEFIDCMDFVPFYSLLFFKENNLSFSLMFFTENNQNSQ